MENLGDIYARELMGHGSSFSSYEADTLEAEIEDYNRRGKINPSVAARIRAAVQVARAAGQGKGSSSGLGTPSKGPKGQASLTINITRVSNNIAGQVVIPLFGSGSLPSGYADVCQQVTPGVSIKSIYAGNLNQANNANQRSLAVTFVDSSATPKEDTCIVTCNEIAYPALLRYMDGGDCFVLNRVRYQISDSTKTQQFNQTFAVNRQSLFGANSSDRIVVSSQRSPMQLTTDLVDVMNTILIDKTRTLNIGIGNFGNNFGVTLYATADAFVQGTAEAELRQKYTDLKG
jgi:hypothetical protein